MTKLQDIKTIDELREFAEKRPHYTIDRDEKIREVRGELTFDFTLSGVIGWSGDGFFGVQLFDSKEEAEIFALRGRRQILVDELKDCEERLARLEKETGDGE